MSQSKTLAQLQLKKNHKGTFYADIEVDGQKLCAYLSNKVIEGGQLYTSPLEDSYYWASINLNNGSAFINQLLPLPQCNEASSELEYHCYCQLLEDGRIHLITEQSNKHIVLPKKLAFSWLYRIFYNSQVIVTFAHKNEDRGGGFVIQQWHTKEPIYTDKSIITNIRKKTDNPNLYLADYYINKRAFLPITFHDIEMKKLGIDSVTEQAVLAASIVFNDEDCRNKVSLSVSPEQLLVMHNQPMASLTFISVEETKQGYKVYKFATQCIDGISLSASAWLSELEHFIKDVSALQPEDTVKVHLIYHMNEEWCNFRFPVAAKDEYNERFRCVSMTSLDNENMALLEAVKPPHDRVFLLRSELIKKGIYAIHSGVEFDLRIKRKGQKNPWQIKDIDKDLFISIDSDKAYKAHCKVVNTWSRYDNYPNYVMKIERSQKNYAFKNHTIAWVRSEYVDLALIIPKALLIARGFRTLDPGEKLSVVFKEIIFPVFTIEAKRILCADDLQDSEDNQGGVGAGESVIVLAEYIEQLPDHIGKKPPYKATPKYGFSIIESDDSAIFTDWEHQMSQVDEPEKYRYKVRTEASKWGIEVKELISASIK